MTRPVTEANLNMHYQSSRIEDTLVCILEVLSLLVKGKGDDPQKHPEPARGFHVADRRNAPEAVPRKRRKEHR